MGRCESWEMDIFGVLVKLNCVAEIQSILGAKLLQDITFF
jgi:hypothetical protein